MAFTLEDRQAVQDLMLRYAEMTDNGGDEAEFLSLFTEDAIFDGPFNGKFSGQEGLLNFVRRCTAKRGKQQGRHVMTNFLITGDDREAKIRCYFTGYRTDLLADKPVSECLYTGNYDCAARKVNGAWKLSRRTVYVDTVNPMYKPAK